MPVRSADGVFNPYHDPANGQFTFAPGGAGGATTTRLAAGPAEPMARGGNARAFEDPMTLEQTFPGLQHAPGGAIIAVADNFLNFWGPATEAQAELLQNWTKQTIADIKALDSQWHLASLGAPTTLEGMTNQLNDLRWQREAITARTKGDYRPMQVETLRFIQQRANAAYEEGKTSSKAGKIRARLSDQEALGNFVDRRVRLGLRQQYSRYGFDEAGGELVRVNRRENGRDLPTDVLTRESAT